VNLPKEGLLATALEPSFDNIHFENLYEMSFATAYFYHKKTGTSYMLFTYIISSFLVNPLIYIIHIGIVCFQLF